MQVNEQTDYAADLQMTAEAPLSENPNVKIEKRAPLAARLKETRPELMGALETLRKKLGDDDYAKYIEPLNNVTKSGGMLLMVAGDLRQKSLLERDFIPQIKEAFEVQVVRLVV
ncbi:hypothetical protein [Schwartzia sp. (in: firmicutes)]